jgi:hypothetical protein
MAADDQDEQHRGKLRAIHAEGGADKVVAFIQSTPDPALRRKLYSLSRQILPDRSSAGRSFDEVIRIARSGIAESLRQAELARAREDAAEVLECIDAANKLSYNLAADLAACWPGDETPRERRHFESGLRAAYDCVVWRQELNKPPDRRAMAHWVAGMHQLSLGNEIEALCAFEAAFGLALESVTAAHGEDDGAPEAYVKPNGDFGVTLYFGYAGIARQRLGDEAGARQFDQACAAFEETMRSPKDAEAEEDARFGLDQLRYVERKYSALSGTGVVS